METSDPGTEAPTGAHTGDSRTTAVADLLTRISTAWRSRRFDDLARCFDENIVMAHSGFSGRTEGRDQLVASYREFMDRATLTSYDERPPVIEVFGDTVIASYRWEMSWRDGTSANHAAGTDLFVCNCSRDRAGDTWRAVWGTMSFEPDAS